MVFLVLISVIMFDMKYTKEQIQEAVAKSSCWRQVIELINPNNNGYSSESYIKARAIKEGIDFSHFKGLGWRKGLKMPPKRPLEFYLVDSVKEASIASSLLKRKLILAGIKPSYCEMCKLTEWMGNKIHVELHHKNKNPNDNRLENLSVLCSNCHSFVHEKIGFEAKHRTDEEYKERELQKLKQKRSERKDPSQKCKCGATLKSYQIKYCSYTCSYNNARKHERPSKEHLTELVSTLSMLKVAEILGVTDNLVRSWCEDYEIDFKSLSPFSHGKAKPKKKGRAFASKYLRVSFDSKRGKWIAKIRGTGKRFDSELEAARAVADDMRSEALVERKTNLPSLDEKPSQEGPAALA